MALLQVLPSYAQCGRAQHTSVTIAVGPPYDTTHVYVAAGDIDAFVKSFVATFGGRPTERTVGNVLPVPSSTEMHYVLSPVGALSVLAYKTPVPFPFGEERTGYLVTNMDQAGWSARTRKGICR